MNDARRQGAGGCAAILRAGKAEKRIQQGWYATTNNRMELRALIAGLKCLKYPCRVEVVTDSKYMITVCENARKYRAQGWHRRETPAGKLKDPVKNADLLSHYLDVSKGHEITFTWIKGHAGHAENEECDRLATEAMSGELTKDTDASEDYIKGGQMLSELVASAGLPLASP